MAANTTPKSTRRRERNVESTLRTIRGEIDYDALDEINDLETSEEFGHEPRHFSHRFDN